MKKILLLVLFLSVIISCKKSQTAKPVTTVQNGQQMLLAEETDYDYYSNGIDTVAIYYAYNSDKQMTSEVSRSPSGFTHDSTLFSYDTNGNLTEIHNITSIVSENTDYFINYQNNEPVSLTGQNINYTYTASNNMLLISNAYYPFLAGDTLIYQGKVLKSFNETIYTYGTHHGPLSTANFKIYLGGEMPFFSTNEVIETNDESTTPATITKYTYTYSSGYPLTLTATYSNGSIVQKVSYLYIAIQ
jgi:hypothetical protein